MLGRSSEKREFTHSGICAKLHRQREGRLDLCKMRSRGQCDLSKLTLAKLLAVVYFVIVRLIVVEGIFVWPQLELQTATKSCFNHWYTTVLTISEICAALKRQPERNIQ